MSKYYDINKMPKERYCPHCKCLTPHSYGKEEVRDIGDNFVEVVLPIRCDTCRYIGELIWTQEKER
jgi:hypothetical protein